MISYMIGKPKMFYFMHVNFVKIRIWKISLKTTNAKTNRQIIVLSSYILLTPCPACPVIVV